VKSCDRGSPPRRFRNISLRVDVHVHEWARKGSNLRPRDYESPVADALACLSVERERAGLR